MKFFFLAIAALLTVTNAAQAQSCYILIKEQQTKSMTSVRIDFIRNGGQWIAGQIEVSKAFSTTKNGSVMVEQNFKIKDSETDNQFKILNPSTLAKGYAEFMFHYPRSGTTTVRGVPGFGGDKIIVSDWVTMGIKDIQPSSNTNLLEGIGGLRDSRSWNTKSYISKDCYR